MGHFRLSTYENNIADDVQKSMWRIYRKDKHSAEAGEDVLMGMKYGIDAFTFAEVESLHGDIDCNIVMRNGYMTEIVWSCGEITRMSSPNDKIVMESCPVIDGSRVWFLTSSAGMPFVMAENKEGITDYPIRHPSQNQCVWDNPEQFTKAARLKVNAVYPDFERMKAFIKARSSKRIAYITSMGILKTEE